VGHTGKEKLDGNKMTAKGKHGDGLQSALSVFVNARTGRPKGDVEIRTCGYQYKYEYRKKAHMDAETLHFQVS
jgi:hypothetical protein